MPRAEKQDMLEASATGPTALPGRTAFARACDEGLSSAYPLRAHQLDDPEGWRFGKGYPPSYHACGRMRALLALTESLRIAPSRVLEVAAGGGGLAATLASAGCQVTANDLRGDALTRELSAYASGGSVAVESGSLFELSPARLGTFDLVIACEVIEHVAHPDALLAHLSAFLAPGGRLLLTTPNGAHFRNRLPSFREAGDPHALEARQFKPDADGHLFLLHPGELCELAAKAGLLVERLNLWGNPLLTGHAGLRVVASAPLVHVAYAAEWLSQRVPSFVRARLCAQMSVVMRKDA